MAGLAVLCTHMYLNRDISHIDGFAGGNEIRGVQIQHAHAHANRQCCTSCQDTFLPLAASVQTRVRENIAINGTVR